VKQISLRGRELFGEADRSSTRFRSRIVVLADALSVLGERPESLYFDHNGYRDLRMKFAEILELARLREPR
jgi:hypothetical protein